ncbi:MAG: CsbD family protein [Bacillus sp. (in: firmicutes)]
MSHTSDKIKGAINKAKGELKDQVGNAKNDQHMQAEGKYEKVKGETQKRIGKMKDALD